MTRVLVVDDKEENIYYLVTLLSGHGFEVESARHGAEALVRARQTPPDVVVSDLLMPVMDGYTLLRQWKADAQLKSVPFIVYTATYTEPEDEQLALKLGADAFILKPAEPDAFLARLKEVEANVAAVGQALPHRPSSDNEGLLREYSETLIRKLEEKTIQLEYTNRTLQQGIRAREKVEAALRESEERLRQAQKMEAVGRLAGGVAHDFNNILFVIMSYAHMALEALGDTHPGREAVTEIQNASERAADLTRQLLTFSRLQLLQPRVLELGRVILNLESMIRRLGEDVQLVLNVSSASGNVYADSSQIEQVVMNLAVNARDAMPRGGVLTIDVANVALRGVDGKPQAPVPPGSYVVLSVADTGVGMDPLTQQRMFEPFFTTKEIGKGTGLGLSTVYGIVKQSGGHITVRSELGKGTTFQIFLPRTDREIQRESPCQRLPPTMRGSETVLLVEDDEHVRAMIGRLLTGHGYTVLQARDGLEALSISDRAQQLIHLLLSDVVMPGLSGRELADRLTLARPELRVLCVSGYPDEAMPHHGVRAAGISFLQKPVAPDALLRKVRELLNA